MLSNLFFTILFGLAAGQEEATTSEQWLITLNTSIFWPTATNYYYGPTTGPEASAVSCNAEWVEYAGRSEGLWSLGPTATSISLGSYATSEGACRTYVSPEAWSDTHTGPLTTLCDADGDLCLQNGTTVPASGLSTAIVNGATFTSPSIYVSFTSIYAWSNRRGHAGFQCGVDHSDVIISVNPETVSSVRNHRNARYPIIGTAYPFNFAEFTPQEIGNYTQSLIPWPQFRGGEQCPLGDSNTCSIIRDDYSPWLLLPEEIRGVDPGWTVCDNDWYIPPVTMVALDRETITVTSTPEPTAEVFAAAMAKNALAASTPQATTRGW
ncbi:hypothetical protein N7481_010595 [Penicillium waksmanii]|uniref:uncharacterized protein n=1 Tax=Penicillium waksmanii TaxID=69791 RepID=UPI0025473A1D|nr:uncharacterized protein N7481_010595 [Penicillium waksmanii]KAJ5973385.1 hypothetical protein N7481_010595 [Penicillium waksmanii]